MTTCEETLRVQVPADEALSACSRALATPVWELVEADEDRVVAEEWLWRVTCTTRPARIEVRIASTSAGQTTLKVVGSVNGFGPIASAHLRRHLEGLIGRIRVCAAAIPPR